MEATAVELSGKERNLREIVRGYGRCIVAFSGGVDSALVLAVAAHELGTGALGVTGVSPSLPAREREGAVAFAVALGARHELLATSELADERYAANPANRCYFCKSELYARLIDVARERGYATIADGLNRDDLAEIRPGRQAATEQGVRSPLAEAAFTKRDVRTLAQRLGLPVWDKPAHACLASRFPTGVAITSELLERVERAEDALVAAGFAECRVRHHGEIARIEVPPSDFAAVLAVRETLVARVRAAGYRFVTLDLAGYVRGGVATPPADTIDLVALAAGSS